MFSSRNPQLAPKAAAMRTKLFQFAIWHFHCTRDPAARPQSAATLGICCIMYLATKTSQRWITTKWVRGYLHWYLFLTSPYFSFLKTRLYLNINSKIWGTEKKAISHQDLSKCIYPSVILYSPRYSGFIGDIERYWGLEGVHPKTIQENNLKLVANENLKCLKTFFTKTVSVIPIWI